MESAITWSPATAAGRNLVALIEIIVASFVQKVPS
jgi:hypothetical protein